jgi:hypothetical protein
MTKGDMSKYTSALAANRWFIRMSAKPSPATNKTYSLANALRITLSSCSTSAYEDWSRPNMGSWYTLCGFQSGATRGRSSSVPLRAARKNTRHLRSLFDLISRSSM